MVDQAAQTSDFTAGNVPATSAAAPGGWETLTRAELETMHIDRMAEIAASMDLDLPDDEGLTDFVDPAEWPAKQVECLNELGFSAQVLQGGVTLDVVSPEQTPALREAMMVCEFRHAVDPRGATQPLRRRSVSMSTGSSPWTASVKRAMTRPNRPASRSGSVNTTSTQSITGTRTSSRRMTRSSSMNCRDTAL